MCKAKYVHSVKIIMFISAVSYLQYPTLRQYNRFLLETPAGFAILYEHKYIYTFNGGAHGD